MAVTVHRILCWRQQVLETLVRFYQTTLYLIPGESIVFKKVFIIFLSLNFLSISLLW